MRRRLLVATRTVVVGGLLLTPAFASAQSATTGGIAGVVRDATGAVLPGVTVEAASPALIEKVRTAVSDDQGQYKIVELRPGTYSVTFTLAGFSIVKREGIELSTGFTAAVNAELRVGAVEETITVTGASPVVDTQNVRTQNVLSRETLDTLPTNKTMQGFATLTVGASVAGSPGSGSTHDVGGNKTDQYGTVNYHGNNADDGRMLFDGMRFNQMTAAAGGRAKHWFVNQADAQEVVLEVAGMSAEAETSGVHLNVVPKTGGNTFQGIFAATGNTGAMQHSNLTDELRARGLTTVSDVKRVYDVGGGLGGPLKRDTLWFYTAHRGWGTQENAAGNFYNKTQGTPFYTPDPSRLGYSDYYNRDHTLRLTWQAASQHKITGSHSVQRNCACHLFVDSGVRSPEASVDYTYFGVSLSQTTWSFPATDRLLFQAGGTWLRNVVSPRAQPEVNPTDVPIIELSRNYNYNAPAVGLGQAATGTQHNYGQHNERFSVSYITGSHAFKAELFTLRGVSNLGHAYVNQDLYYLFRNGVPVLLTQWASPNHVENTFNNLGLFVQDQWTIERLTLNLGVRYDSFNAYVPEQTRPAGQYVEEIRFSRIDNVPNFRDIAPRIGAAYDLFGNGKTAIKASVGRYVGGLGSSLTDSINPANAIVANANRTWNDANGNYLPDCNLRNFGANGECGDIDNRAFGTVRVTRRYEQDVLEGWGNREYNWQVSTSIQQELWPNVAVNVGYFYSRFLNFRVFDNVVTTPADYDPFCITAPRDSRLPGGGGYQVCDLGDVNPAKFGLSDSVLTQASTFGDQTQTYHGVDGVFSARFGDGGMFGGGFSTGRTATQCVVVDAPMQFCRNVPPFLTQYKFNGSYPLPWWGIQASATYQNLPGAPISITYVPTNAEIAPSLGRSLAACGTTSPCNAAFTTAGSTGIATATSIFLVEPNTVFEDRLSQLDVRLTKIVRVRRVRLQGMLDVYNVFNASTVLTTNGRYGGSTFLLPSVVMGGRTFKFGAQLDF